MTCSRCGGAHPPGMLCMGGVAPTKVLCDIFIDTERGSPYSLGETIASIPSKLKSEIRSNSPGLYRIKLERIERPMIVTSTTNFSMGEFRCKDGTPVPDDMRADTLRLMQQLEVLRDELDDSAVRIVSGYRSPSYNRSIGGAKSSKHMLGQAADIRVGGHSPSAVADAIERLIASGDMEDGGLGRYPGFTHYDVRGKRARWGSN